MCVLAFAECLSLIGLRQLVIYTLYSESAKPTKHDGREVPFSQWNRAYPLAGAQGSRNLLSVGQRRAECQETIRM